MTLPSIFQSPAEALLQSAISISRAEFFNVGRVLANAANRVRDDLIPLVHCRCLVPLDVMLNDAALIGTLSTAALHRICDALANFERAVGASENSITRAALSAFGKMSIRAFRHAHAPTPMPVPVRHAAPATKGSSLDDNDDDDEVAEVADTASAAPANNSNNEDETVSDRTPKKRPSPTAYDSAKQARVESQAPAPAPPRVRRTRMAPRRLDPVVLIRPEQRPRRGHARAPTLTAFSDDSDSWSSSSSSSSSSSASSESESYVPPPSQSSQEIVCDE